MSIRAEKVASVIKQVIAVPVSEIALSRGYSIVTVTSVRLSSDLQVANVYISIFAPGKSPADFLEIMEKKKGEIRTIIAKNVRLRFAPHVRFFLDDTLDQMDHIQDLLDQTKKERKEEQEDEKEN